jgi:hypothetical protein
MIGELCIGDWVFGWCLVSDLDLSLEFVVPGPLIYVVKRLSLHSESVINANHTPLYGYASLFCPRAELALWHHGGFDNDH